jgi:hypothetical protein
MSQVQQFITYMLGVSFLSLMYFLPLNYFDYDGLQSNCIHMRILGFQCPGCGFTRALHSLVHLNFKRAITYNPAVVFVYPIFIMETLNLLNKNALIVRLKILFYSLFIVTLFVLYLCRFADFFQLLTNHLIHACNY